MDARRFLRLSPLFSVSSVLNFFPYFRPPRYQISFNPNYTCREEVIASSTPHKKPQIF
jgi:hypothetical protein